jgi:hypothetical protein
VCFVSLVLITFGANSVHATPITLDISGDLQTVDSQLEPFFSVGDAMTASLTYDSSVGPSGGGPLNAFFLDAITSLTFTVGDFAGEQNEPSDSFYTNEIDMIDTGTRDSIVFWSSFTPTLPGFQSFRFRITLIDVTGVVFDDLTLPSSIDPADFNFGSTTLELFEPLNRFARVRSDIDGVSPPPPPPEPMPEPSIVALLSLGIAGLGSARYRIKVWVGIVTSPMISKSW